MMKKLQELARITGAVKDVELSKLSEIQAQLDQLEQEITALREGPKGQLDHGWQDAAVFAAAELKYAKWKEPKLRELLAQKARIAAQKEEQLLATRRAFGRHQAIEKQIRS